jgi:cell division protein FtsZ
MVDEKLDDQVWVTVVATRYGEARKPRPERRMEEPAGEPRVERRTPPMPEREREREPVAAGRGGVVSDHDVPEFLPRRR